MIMKHKEAVLSALKNTDKASEVAKLTKLPKTVVGNVLRGLLVGKLVYKKGVCRGTTWHLTSEPNKTRLLFKVKHKVKCYNILKQLIDAAPADTPISSIMLQNFIINLESKLELE